MLIGCRRSIHQSAGRPRSRGDVVLTLLRIGSAEIRRLSNGPTTKKSPLHSVPKKKRKRKRKKTLAREKLTFQVSTAPNSPRTVILYNANVVRSPKTVVLHNACVVRCEVGNSTPTRPDARILFMFPLLFCNFSSFSSPFISLSLSLFLGLWKADRPPLPLPWKPHWGNGYPFDFVCLHFFCSLSLSLSLSLCLFLNRVFLFRFRFVLVKFFQLLVAVFGST